MNYFIVIGGDKSVINIAEATVLFANSRTHFNREKDDVVTNGKGRIEFGADDFISPMSNSSGVEMKLIKHIVEIFFDGAGFINL